jgi:hypothetical protein
MLRLRQAVVAVTDLDSSAEYLQSELGLGEPFADPDVAYFGLRNAVFAIGDTFLELVSPAGEGTAAGRLIERRGGDTGYMAMLQVDDVAEARQRASVLGIREVFNIEFEDIGEAHLHPADIGGAIVSISEPRPETSWRWGGPGWTDRSVPGSLVGVTVAVSNPADVADQWQEVAGGPIPVTFEEDPAESGIVAIELDLDGRTVILDPAAVTH